MPCGVIVLPGRSPVNGDWVCARKGDTKDISSCLEILSPHLVLERI